MLMVHVRVSTITTSSLIQKTCWKSYLKIERYINWIYENICYTYMYITNIYGMLLVHVKLTYMICLYLL